MPLLTFLLQCAPILALGGLLAILGGRAGENVPAGAGWMVMAGGIVLLGGLVLFKRVPGWNLAFLLTLAFVGGALFPSAFGRGNPWWISLLGACGVALSIGLAYGARVRFGRLAIVLMPVLLIYAAVWLVMPALPLGFHAPAIWALPGLLLFTLWAVNALSDARDASVHPDPTAVASDLFVAYFNLWLCAAMVGGFLARGP